MINISKEIVAYKERFPVSSKVHHAEIYAADRHKDKITKPSSSYEKIEFSNLPLPGFTLLRVDDNDIQLYRNYWKIIDPRGFVVRITSKNLNNLMHYSGITEGLIQEECVWAREDENSVMELISINDPRYLEAVKNTELLEDRVDVKTVEIGDRVFLQNGHTGIYMGTMTMHTQAEVKRSKICHKVLLGKQVILIENSSSIPDYLYKTDLKILKILEKSVMPMSQQQVIKKINQEIESGNVAIHYDDRLKTGSIKTGKNIVFVTTSKKKPSLLPVEVDYQYALSVFTQSFQKYMAGLLVVEDANNRKYVVDHWSMNSYGTFDKFSAKEVNISSFDLTVSDVTCVKDRRLDSFVKFYIIKKIINDHESYL